ncbi:hypothetical protein EVJ22_13500 [Exiguobacterium sp. SH0S7]|uniref:AAA family ATPase n=1 Tax=Exiguobacterium sp. SH0S7 TaxID=2510951 RepID=UPI00103C18AF|nr:AAA family ATPase [Exiguobacterium sp. SH0S7]TCI67867.1 hypothetical protein EVJ22_13500 [Exiguobacterium sp. SH0S7]
MQIAVDNFRSFAYTEYLCSSDLNVFIGRNSSGKSSLLRLFPLLKQTFANDTSEPFLWYSPDYVDFGEYANVVGSDSSKPISFLFNFNLAPSYFYNSNRMYNLISLFSTDELSTKNYFDIVHDLDEWDISLQVDALEDYISKVTLNFLDMRIVLNFNKHVLESFKVNTQTIYNNRIHKNSKIVPHKRNFFSLIRPSYSKMHQASFVSDNNDDTSVKNNESLSRASFSELFINPRIMELFEKIFPSSEITYEEIEYFFMDDFLFLDREYIEELFEEHVNIDLYRNEIDELIDLYVASYTNDFLLAIDKYFEDYFSKVKYIAPLRAPVQRYYRLQGISLSEVDPSGLNIPMIIANMNDKEVRKFTKWTKENFGFFITREMTPGHVSILIGVGQEKPRNIIDLGFGYSQILPIIVELWHTSIRANSNRKNQINVPYTIVIEQPELHLHPAMQADFIDACINLIQNIEDNGVKIIIETHSETIINRISESIKKERLNHDSVTINIVNRDEENNSSVNLVEFDLDGDFTEWPIGFFAAESLKYDYKN